MEEDQGPQRPSKGNGCGRCLLNLDVQGRNFNFYLPDGNLTYKTSSGGFCFLIFAVIWLAYAVG